MTHVVRETLTQATTVLVLEHSPRPSSILCVGTRMYPHQMRSSVFCMAFLTLKHQQVPGFLLTEGIENGCLGSSFNVVSMGEQQQSKTTSPLPSSMFFRYIFPFPDQDRPDFEAKDFLCLVSCHQPLNSKLLFSEMALEILASSSFHGCIFHSVSLLGIIPVSLTADL